MLEHPVVGGQLDRRRRGAAVGRATAGGEGDQVGPASHLAGGRNRVVTGGIHEHQALGAHRFRILVHIDQVAGAGLGHRTEGLLEDGGQAPGLVAGRGVVVQFGVHALAVVFPPADAGHQFFANLAADRTAGQQVLGTVDFRGLGENRGATGGHQTVDGIAQRRVGGNAGIAIGTATLQADHQVPRTDRLALHLVGLGQQRLDLLDTGGDGFAGAADTLDGEGAQLGAGLQALGFQQAFDLVGFAAQADDQHGSEIGVYGVPGQGATQQAQGFTAGVHRTAGAVGQRYHAVDVRVIGQHFRVDVAAKMVGHGPGHGRRAVHRGEDADVVAGGDPAIGAHDALELRLAAGLAAGVDTEGVVTGEIAHLHVVHMHVFTGVDGLRGKADDLPVTAQGLALLHTFGSKLVARGDRLAHGNRLGVQAQALRQGLAGDEHVVQRVEADDGKVTGLGNQLHGTSQGGAAGFLLWLRPL
ncbi:hypothetical protein D3C76_872210 [compost metagenome]